MNKKIYLMAGLSFILASASVFAAPTADNYRGVIQGIQAKFDRDWNSLNPQGQPDPGALATLEKFLQAMNEFNISGPGTYHKFMPNNSAATSCSSAGPTCQEVKVLVRASQHLADSTLFGVQQSFDWDIVVWSNSGSGYSRFLEGYYSKVEGSVGKGNLTLISCSGCSTVGHSQIEWDGTGATYHLRSKMYDTRFVMNANPQIYGGAIIDAVYNPLSGEMKLAVAATNVCDSSGVGDSICGPGGNNDHTTGYAAVVHADTISGNVYIEGVQGANNSALTPSADAMCIKSDRTQDVAGTACTNDGISNFNGITAYAPADAPASFINADWPMNEITDAPAF